MVTKLKNNKKALFITITVVILLVAILIPLGFAAGYDSSNTFYNNDSTRLGSETLKDSIDKMNYFAEVNCPVGKVCKSNTPKCKRATTLHTETCSNSSSNTCLGSGYESGATITYGNTTTTEGVLTTGDAFDCDVNGDGTYDSSTERFYYVSDYYDTSTKNFNDNLAVLVYYSNVREGVASKTGTAYDCTRKNNNGPVTAREQLPTTTQWSNIRLYKETRQILTPGGSTATQGGNLPAAFSYSGYAARLLTYQEAYNGCNSFSKQLGNTGGIEDKCQFLMERTEFSGSGSSVWLESPDSSNNTNAYVINAYNRYIINGGTYSTSYGVRPVFEILKSEISY